MTDHRGAYVTYADRPADKYKFYGASCYKTQQITVLSGQVLKAGTPVESNTVGKSIAHSGMNEKALVTFPTKVDTGETVIIAGLTFTAGSKATTSQAELVAAWKGLTAGMTASQANAAKTTETSAAIGTFTSGTLTGYNTYKSSTTGSVLFVSTTPNAGVTDLTVTGTGDASTVAVTAVSYPNKPIQGILVYDVDASAGDVDTSIYIEADFWDTYIVWENNPDTDYILSEIGTQVPVTDYVSGATSNLLKKKFFENARDITVSGFNTAGETY